MGSTLEIRISYDDGDLYWPGYNEQIRTRSQVYDAFPNFLILTGPVFDVTITARGMENQHSSANQHEGGRPQWEYTSPSFLEGAVAHNYHVGRYRGPPFSLEEVDGNTTLHLVALAFFAGFREYDFIVHVLMLRPVDEDDDGPIYERVTCSYFDSMDLGPDFSLDDMNLRQMELRIR